MKKHILFLLMFLSVHTFPHAKNIPEKDALIVAKKCMKGEYLKTTEPFNVHVETYKGSTSFYIFNFIHGGFVIVAADDRINPILGYSYSGKLIRDNKNTPINALLTSYNEKIFFLKRNKSEQENRITKAKWDNILTGSILTETHKKSVMLDVPSLFETEQTSRWAYWSGYNIMLPEQNGTSICVPLAMAQICKYHKHPKQGEGTNSYYVNGNYCYINYEQYLYNYNLMPFRLTYCGNGEENCDEGSFDFLPGITTENKEEISKLIYHIGLGVSMHWAAYTIYSGTYGSADSWAFVFSNNLGYKSTWVHWNNNEIHANPNAFKAAIRNNLNDGLPILFRVGGHAIVVDGFEDEVYFHGAYGRGGFTDGYYYLFIDDADGVHITLPNSTNYQAVLDLEPDYSFPVDLSIDTTISASTTACYQALNSVSLSSVIEGNGSSGANIATYANKVTLNPGFEIKKGGTLYINNENY